MSRLEEIEAREKKAAKVPWMVFPGDHPIWVDIGSGEVCHQFGQMRVARVVGSVDADFIAHSRQDIPYLLRVARAAEKLMPLCADFCGTCVETNCETCEVTMAKEEFKNAMEDKNA